MKKINLEGLSFEIRLQALKTCYEIEDESKNYCYETFDLKDYDDLFKPLLNHKIKAIRESARDYREVVKDTLVFEAQEDFNEFMFDNLNRFIKNVEDYTKEKFA